MLLLSLFYPFFLIPPSLLQHKKGERSLGGIDWRLLFVQRAHYVLHICSVDLSAAVHWLACNQVELQQQDFQSLTLPTLNYSASGIFGGVFHQRSESRWFSTVASGEGVSWHRAAVTVTAWSQQTHGENCQGGGLQAERLQPPGSFQGDKLQLDSVAEKKYRTRDNKNKRETAASRLTECSLRLTDIVHSAGWIPVGSGSLVQASLSAVPTKKSLLLYEVNPTLHFQIQFVVT